MIGQGAKGSDGTKVRTWVGTLRFVIAPLERAAMPGNPIRATHRGQRSSDRADRPDT